MSDLRSFPLRLALCLMSFVVALPPPRLRRRSRYECVDNLKGPMVVFLAQRYQTVTDGQARFAEQRACQSKSAGVVFQHNDRISGFST